MTIDELKAKAGEVGAYIVTNLWAKAACVAAAGLVVGWIAGRLHFPF